MLEYTLVTWAKELTSINGKSLLALSVKLKKQTDFCYTQTFDIALEQIQVITNSVSKRFEALDLRVAKLESNYHAACKETSDEITHDTPKFDDYFDNLFMHIRSADCVDAFASLLDSSTTRTTTA